MYTHLGHWQFYFISYFPSSVDRFHRCNYAIYVILDVTKVRHVSKYNGIDAYPATLSYTELRHNLHTVKLYIICWHNLLGGFEMSKPSAGYFGKYWETVIRSSNYYTVDANIT